MTLSTTFRRAVLAAALATAGVSIVAMPPAAQAAPAGVDHQIAGRQRVIDPLAARALEALAAFDLAASGDTAATRSFDAIRDEIAAEAAARVGIEPARMQVAWQLADGEHQRAILAAFTELGTPYRRNTSKPGVGFDCSGLTTYAWGQAGYTLTRQSSAQIRAAAPRTPETAQAGDLVQYPGHVMMWLGVDRAIIHAPYSGRTVEIDVVKSRRSLRWGDPTG